MTLIAVKSEVISLFWGKVSGLSMFGERQKEARCQVLAGLDLLALTLLGSQGPIWLLFLKHEMDQ